MNKLDREQIRNIRNNSYLVRFGVVFLSIMLVFWTDIKVDALWSSILLGLLGVVCVEDFSIRHIYKKEIPTHYVAWFIVELVAYAIATAFQLKLYLYNKLFMCIWGILLIISIFLFGLNFKENCNNFIKKVGIYLVKMHTVETIALVFGIITGYETLVGKSTGITTIMSAIIQYVLSLLKRKDNKK